MKLSHYDSGTLAEPEFSELEILKAENEFLRDELRIQELEKSLEIYEAIFDCIEKEGGVSSSLEMMFGENWSDKNTALDELKKSKEEILDSLEELSVSTVMSKVDPVSIAWSCVKKLKEKIKTVGRDAVWVDLEAPITLSSKGTTVKMKALIENLKMLSFVRRFYTEYKQESKTDPERENRMREWKGRFEAFKANWDEILKKRIQEESQTLKTFEDVRSAVNSLYDLLSAYQGSEDVKNLKNTLKNFKNYKAYPSILKDVARAVSFIQRAIAHFVIKRCKELNAARFKPMGTRRYY